MDELNHVSNLVYVRWVLDVALAHSVAAGYDYPAYRALGAVFVVRRHEIEYLRPAFAGDRIRLSTWLDSWRGASTVRATRITRLEPSEGQERDGMAQWREVELARAKTMWVLVEVASGRPTRIPGGLKTAFAEFEPSTSPQ